MHTPNNILESPVEYLKGVGPAKADLLKKELGIFSFGDLLLHFPYRYVDRTRFTDISAITDDMDTVLLRGVLRRVEVAGEGYKKRLVARLRDATGHVDLVWFQGIHWMEKQLQPGEEYIVFGKVNWFNNQLSIPHPEVEKVSEETAQKALTFAPVYPSTEKLNAKGLDAKGRRRLMEALFEKIRAADIPENLPDALLEQHRFISRYEALFKIHFPKNEQELEAARWRLKFEELFFLQLRLLQLKLRRKETVKGYVFGQIGTYFNTFFNEKLPFSLTNAQKKVLREIRRDLGIGVQMNRLLQGDVGSGKTIVGFMTMLMAIDNGFQACLMAPTEILAQQHYNGIRAFSEALGLNTGFLSGTVKGKKRKALLEQLADGSLHILIGTHALIEDPVVFNNLGLAITDEQHRFGVAQRAKLWKKGHPLPPHILVMTATPIPRTLAMTLYGDLDVSVIDELPPGRKEIVTVHRTEHHRLRVIGFMREQIALGRQVYVVYPLIEESETLDLQNLMNGYDSLCREFPQPEYQISIVHGKMKPADKDFEMQRFVEGTTQIMVATTVIEVGVNVPNATVMVVENTERFGLSQLHQLRGRVGRGGDQSFCILMSSFKLSADAKARIQTMCRTTNGFEIAEADLKLRGPGDLEGTQQSGILNLHIADLAKDGAILQSAREAASALLEKDPHLQHPGHQPMVRFMQTQKQLARLWSRIS